ncbi:MAG: 2-amino-4-hydroxy-6-hydroxymethyldihydropteridine diphosphokinase [Clostridia bacterium]|nr:2-amino-4-hydroxy-6-hydroxymethyldihydropteridine pyrophosphokinase [Clostridiales bacterium]MDK2985357.1 2-amino-4-hydroxy-6-hydroxymethyldihydropteridine diphosphokinase [Clostridia bacterium]
MNPNCYLSIGSNMGNKEYYLNGAVESLRKNPDITVTNVSSYYETEPFGVQDQPKFLNGVVEIETSLTPPELLRFIQDVEKKFDRVRIKRWGPRTLDIDILLYDNLKISEPDLTIPHPYLEKRAFVLVPLAELNPNMVLPSGRNIKSVLEDLKEDVEGIVKYKF